jgi:hypothetical protein
MPDDERRQMHMWVVRGVICFLAAGGVFMFALGSATDDTSSSGSHSLDIPIAACAALGLACLIRAG